MLSLTKFGIAQMTCYSPATLMPCYSPLRTSLNLHHNNGDYGNRERRPFENPHRPETHNPCGVWPNKPNWTNPSYPYLGPFPRSKPPHRKPALSPNPSPTSPIATAAVPPRFGPSIPTICFGTNRHHTQTRTPRTKTNPKIRTTSHSPLLPRTAHHAATHRRPSAAALLRTLSVLSATSRRVIRLPHAPSLLASIRTRTLPSPIATSYTIYDRLTRLCRPVQVTPPTQKKV